MNTTGQGIGSDLVPIAGYAMTAIARPGDQSHPVGYIRRLLISSNYDLEEKDGFGSPVLLQMSYLRTELVLEMIDMFLLFGASLCTTLNCNAGILHQILHSNSDCSRG